MSWKLCKIIYNLIIMRSVEINRSANCLECKRGRSRFKANQQETPNLEAKHQAEMPAFTKSKKNQMKTPRMIPEARTWVFILYFYTEYQKASKKIMVNCTKSLEKNRQKEPNHQAQLLPTNHDCRGARSSSTMGFFTFSSSTSADFSGRVTNIDTPASVHSVPW